MAKISGATGKQKNKRAAHRDSRTSGVDKGFRKKFVRTGTEEADRGTLVISGSTAHQRKRKKKRKRRKL